MDRKRTARFMGELARAAGRLVMPFLGQDCLGVIKPDSSPVTEADHASEALILGELSRAFPEIPVISEEHAASHTLSPEGQFFLVDPLDGTKSFLAGMADFCVLIALIEHGVPVSGALHAPVHDQTWWAGSRLYMAQGELSAAKEVVPFEHPPREGGPVAIVTARHGNLETERYLAEQKVQTVQRMSSALKFVALAKGEADLYPRRGPCMQWDVAAGDALLRSVGGGVVLDDGQLMRYGAGAEDWLCPPFVAHARLKGTR
jgi:3'(2'), 5'-bisphosphate nucleotidase